MTEKSAVEKIRRYAEKYGYTVEEYEDISDAIGDDKANFVIGWQNNKVVYFAIQNSLISPPDEIKWLCHISMADVNQREGDLSWLGKLKNLRSLFLKVWQENLPQSLTDISTLKSVFLEFPLEGNIRILPSALRKCKSLTLLDVSAVFYSIELPDWIHELSNLKKLSLVNCYLKSIPYSVVKTGLEFVLDHDVHRPDGIHLFGAELEEGDISLFGQSREIIEQYYTGKQETVKECKVIFLGDGAAGKSSLIDRIINDTFQEGTLATDGVRISAWHTDVNGEPICLRILDFGGQEIMHAMHRCFLTTHTVYVVVCEIRNDSEIDREAARWLENIKAFAPGCPVILALNKADQNSNVSVNERNLKKINPELRCVLKTSAKWPMEKGVADLIKAIREEVPNCINDFKLSADMLGIKQELEQMKEDYISAQEYQSICAKYNIKEPDLQQSMLNWFKDLGVAYFYSSEQLNTRLENIRVLNPAWLTNGIYRLILRTPANGFLLHQTIKETLQATDKRDVMPDKVYTPQETEFILYVMRVFEISHNMQNGVEMIPMKMAKTPPDEIDTFPRSNALHLRWESSYLPNNLIHRLMIRMNAELNKDCVWRTGAWFQRNESNALSEMSETALDVYVHAPYDCRQYMEEFRVQIQQILNSMNIKAHEVICCKIGGEEGFIPYEDVLQQYRDGMPKIYIRDIKKYISPVELLQETYLRPEEEIERYNIANSNVYIGKNVAIGVSGGTAAINLLETQNIEVLAESIRNTNDLEITAVEDIKAALTKISQDKELSFWHQIKLKRLIRQMKDAQPAVMWEKIRGYLGDVANLSAIFPFIQQCAPYLLDIFKKLLNG